MLEGGDESPLPLNSGHLSKKKRYGQRFTRWGNAVVKARKKLAIKEFCPIGGKTAAGKKLYAHWS